MFRWHTFFRTALALSAGSCAVAASAQDLNALLQRSPFGSANASGQTAAAEGPLEFRSVLFDQGEYFFSVYQPSTKTSLWVGLNETGNPFTVQSYDEKTETVKIDYQGRSLSLALKQAKIQAFVQKMPTAPQTVQPQPNGQPIAAPGSSAEEAARLARVAEEIRRRRALRQQGGPPNQPPGAPQNPNSPGNKTP
ncbi:MAG: hypothetical protein HY300_19170 [Verrucomicrobia bacterium]|nr:hypothetical protein [Verrucomicrobiota bacterium]